MNPGDEMAVKTEPSEHQSAGVAAHSDNTFHKFDLRSRALKDLQRTIDQRKPVEDLHGSHDKLSEQLCATPKDLLRPSPQQKPEEEDEEDLLPQQKPVKGLPSFIPRISDRLDEETSDRVRATGSRTKKRPSRRFARYLVAICIGVAGTLAWQSYGKAAKQIIATSAPELGWSPEAKQIIASWVQQLGWAKPPTDPENTAVQLPVPMPQAAPPVQAGAETVTSTLRPAAPSLDQQQVQQMEADLAAVKQTVEQRLATVRENVEQLAVGQDQVLREIAKLHQEILNTMPTSSPQPRAAPTRKPKPVPPSSRAPTAPPTLQAPMPPH